MIRHVHIVGCGLAGALLMHELRKRGIHVTVNDRIDPQSSSNVAAGMITPITGQRLKPTWRGEELTAHARRTYAELEDVLGIPLWKDWTLVRVFRSEMMRTWFEQRRDRGELNNLDVEELSSGVNNGIDMPYGGFRHGGVATVHIAGMLAAMRTTFADAFIDAPAEDADVLVTCTGAAVLHDPLWSWLPIEPSKGEILDVRIDGDQCDHIRTNGTWILPCGDSVFRIGATHDWDDHDPTPTEAARETLLAEAAKLVHRTITVIDQRAALRPSTKYKRPLVGRHPETDRNAVFTGLGTKGAVQGPWSAHQLAEHLVNGVELDPEIAIARWWKS